MKSYKTGLRKSWFLPALCSVFAAGSTGWGQQTRDPLLDLMIQKGIITQEEAVKVQAEADARRTNSPERLRFESPWIISDAVKKVELYGDIKVRYEQRRATTPGNTRIEPGNGSIELDRGRGALRFGLRGELYDQFYFGLRLETSQNPRSTWVTFGSSNGQFGRSTLGVTVGQAYLGLKPWDWLDLTAGKMPNPLYTTPMVWDPDLEPEGAAEHLKYSIGNADFFANFGQFLYQDNNPNFISAPLTLATTGNSSQEHTDNTFLLSWQGGFTYHFTKEISAKVAGTLYHFLGAATNNNVGNIFIGESAYNGPGGGTLNGLNVTGSTFPNNQVGINNLLIVDLPMEVNFKIHKLNAKLFGDFAYNLDGSQRATAAVNALAANTALLNAGGGNNRPPLLDYGPQTSDVKAYQVGFAIGNGDSLGLVYGSVAKRNTWEFRTYWQHVEQYALDPNLLDSDFFEGRGNLEGIYTAFAYGFTDNMIGTIRYGYAHRINDKLGTGGSNLDIPQLNPIEKYTLLQLDMTLKF